eukprot:9570145-Karenia_brevis.AAC.1
MSQFPEAMYKLPGREPETWVRYEVREGKGYVGCIVCRNYFDSGHSFKGRQCLGRWQLRADSPNNHAKDTVEAHVRKPSGDHQKAMTELLKEHAPDSAERDEAVPKAARTTTHQANVVYFAYTCLRRNLSGGDYRALIRATYAINAELPDAYYSETTYAEIIDCVGDVLFLDLLDAMKKSP